MAGPTRPRACLVGFGTAGDVHPLLALARDLRGRGHPVTLMANPVFAPLAGKEGLEFVPISDASDQENTLAHPKLWHPVDGLGVMWRYLLRPALEPTYRAVERLTSQGPCVVLASPVAMGARLAQEKLGVPLVSLYTAATLLRTTRDPMTLAQWQVPPWCPRVLRHAAWRLLDRFKLDPLARPALDDLRARLGLPRLREPVFGTWMHSPQGGLALFPAWFAPAPPDWPRQVVQAGFPLFDDGHGDPVPADVDRFVQAGAPPVVFMPGTGQRFADRFFRAAVRACADSGERGLLLGNVPGDLARELPPQVHAARYAPFHWLLPRARALVHHGGVGSCAQALRAGLPQLVLPSAYDQFDNAMRLQRLGVGVVLPGGFKALPAVGARLRQLLADPQVRQACTRWAPEATPVAARGTVARLVDQLAPA